MKNDSNWSYNEMSGSMPRTDNPTPSENFAREMELILRRACQVCQLGAWSLEVPSMALSWTQEVREIHGVADDFVPTMQSAMDFYTAEYRTEITQAAEQCISHGVPFDKELQLEAVGGTIVWVRSVGEAVRDDQGTIVRIQGAFQDISQQKRAKEALEQSEQRFRELAEHLNDVFYIFCLNPVKTLYISPGYLTIWGRTQESLYQDPLSFLNAVHGEDRPAVDDRLVRQGEGKATNDEYRIVRPDGEVRWVHDKTFPVHNAEGVLERTVGVASDITIEKLALTQLQLSEERFRLLSRATSDAVYDHDLRTDQMWGNEGFETLFGRSCGEMTTLDEAWTSHLHLEDRDRVLATLKSGTEGTSEHLEVDYRFHCQDGRVAQVRDRAYIIRDENGKALRVIGSMTDITVRQQLEQQALRTQRLESIATLAGGLAHDLNNLLAPILLSTEILSDYVTNDSDGQSVLATVKSSAERASLLIRGILGFAQSVDNERIFLDLRQLTEEIEETVRQTFPENIVFSRTAASDLWSVHADANQIYQVLLSLCHNARDAMPNGGELKISLFNDAVDEVITALHVDSRLGSNVVLRVEDTGRGMSPQVQSRIFEPFFTTKEVGEGSGLGLSTAFSIVRGQGGFIHVYSEPGEGTKFEIHLPASSHPAVSGPQVDVPRNGLPKGNGELVLLVDDDNDVRGVAAKILERFGYRVLPAGDGAEAVSLFRQRRAEIDLVLTDMTMPVMDGPTMISALRAIDPRVRVIGSSGLVSSSNVARAVSVGIEHFVAKPYTVAALLQTLQAVLSQPVVSPMLVALSPTQEQTTLIKPANPTLGKRLLVVDDLVALTRLSKRVLEKSGFVVLTADSAEEALALLEESPPQLALDGLITDLNLPGVDGYELARLVRERFPLVKVMLSSGTFIKTETTAEHCVLPKPYSPAELVSAVTSMLQCETAR